MPLRIVSSRSVSLLAGVAGLAAVEPLGDEEPTAHEPLRVVEGRTVLAEATGAEIDDVTGYCLSCHDGSAGPLVTFARPEAERTGGWVVGSRSPPQWPKIHPVKVRYPAERRGFHADGPRDRRIVLLGGEVTCISCHDCERLDRRLVVSRARSQLCLSCHDK